MSVLPPAIADFFATENGKDPASLTACFSPDAVVHDESNEYRGSDAIAAWRLDTQAKTPFTSRPLNLRDDDDTFLVSAEVSGSFPNSPIILEHRFRLVDGCIAALDIG